MSLYNLEFNKDDSVIRSIIVALLAELKSKIYIYHTTDQVRQRIDVPFYPAVTGQEGFLLDVFLNDEVSDPLNTKAIGTYDVVPRGVVSFASLDIDSGSLLNKFGRMEKLKNENNQLIPYSYETQMLPINMTFDIKIAGDSFVQMLKIVQACFRKLYKNNQFKIDLGGYHIAGTFAIPESLDQEKLFEFSFSDKKTYDINFSLELSSFIPVFEEDTEMFAGNILEDFTMSVKDMDKVTVDLINKNMGYNDNADLEGGLYPAGGDYVPPTDTGTGDKEL